MNRCLFCGNIPEPLEYALESHIQFECCVGCGTALVYTIQEQKTLAQCCECGVMLSGPGAGMIFTLQNGKPDLSIGVSHGMCPSCAEKKLAVWQQRRAARSTSSVMQR